MRLRKRLLLVPVIIGAGLWLTFGESVYNFCTQAEYEAPKTGFRIKIVGSGTVEDGHDLSEGHSAIAIVCPVASVNASAAKSILLTRTGLGTAEYAVTDGEFGILDWDFRSESTVLASVFMAAGYGNKSPSEIAEAMRVFVNVSYGPKGTVMPGQSEFLIAKSVDFDGEACLDQISRPLDCSSR